MQFQPYKIEEVFNEYNIELRLWGLTSSHEEVSRPVLVVVKNVEKIFYLELPKAGMNYMGMQEPIDWDLNHDQFLGLIEKYTEKCIYTNELKRVDFYSEETRYMIKVHFKTRNQWRRFTNIANKGFNFLGMKVYVKFIEERVTCVQRAMVEHNFYYTSWLEVPLENIVRPDNSQSTIEEYEIDCVKDLRVMKESEVSRYYTSPKILSYDFETYSPNDNMFPKADNVECCIFMCGYTIKDRDGKKKHIIHVLGDLREMDFPQENHVVEEILQSSAGKWNPGAHFSGRFEGPVGVRLSKNECEFIRDFSKIIREESPDILIGYNIFKFDNKYIQERAQLLTGVDMGNGKKFPGYVPNFGRLKNDKAELNFVKMEHKTAAFGMQSMVYMDVPGIITIDVLGFIEKTYKFSQYKLDMMGKEFLNDVKDDISAQYMFDAYRKQHGLTKDKKIDHHPMMNVAGYCIQDCDLVIRLFEKLNLWFTSIETSKVVNHSPQEIHTMGQQRRVYTVLQREAHKSNYVMKNRENPPDLYIKGAYVGTPTPGIYENVKVWDFASLYPTIMIANNICYTTFVDCIVKEYDASNEKLVKESGKVNKNVKDEDCNIAEILQEEPKDISREDPETFEEKLQQVGKDKKKVEMCYRRYRIRYVKPHIRKGILPSVVSGLVNERRRVRSKMKETSDPIEKNILNARQLALKVTGNSAYGFTGIRKNGVYPMLEASVSITGWGREYIDLTVKTITEEYAKFGSEVLYLDTDSSFARFKKKLTKEESLWLNEDVTRKMAEILPKPMVFEYEKEYKSLLLVTKKRYAGYLYESEKFNEDGSRDLKKAKDGSIYLCTNGISLARRDNTKFLRDTQARMLEYILNNKKSSDSLVLDYLIRRIVSLIEGNVNARDLTIVKKLGSEYKDENSFMNLFSKNLEKRGKPVKASERLEYLQIKKKNPEDKLGDSAILWDEYVELSKKETIELDIGYYIKTLISPIDQIFDICFREKYKERYIYEPSNRRLKNVALNEPIKLINLIFNDSMKSQTKDKTCEKITVEKLLEIKEYV